MQKRLGWRFQRNLSIADVIEPLSDGQRYARKMLAVAPNNLIGYWPMWELAGNIAYDRGPEGNNGAYSGVTLGQPGIGDGRSCPYFDGTNLVGLLYRAILRNTKHGKRKSNCITDSSTSNRR
jgi:hypothetical protein